MECVGTGNYVIDSGTHALLIANPEALYFVTAMTYLSQAPLQDPCETVAKS